MEKEIYETPEIEVIRFETEDVITTSGGEESGIGSISLWPEPTPKC